MAIRISVSYDVSQLNLGDHVLRDSGISQKKKNVTVTLILSLFM